MFKRYLFLLATGATVATLYACGFSPQRDIGVSQVPQSTLQSLKMPNAGTVHTSEGITDWVDGAGYKRPSSSSPACEALFTNIDTQWTALVESEEMRLLLTGDIAKRLAAVDRSLRELQCHAEDERAECVALERAIEELNDEVEKTPEFPVLIDRIEKIKLTVHDAAAGKCYARVVQSDIGAQDSQSR